MIKFNAFLSALVLVSISVITMSCREKNDDGETIVRFGDPKANGSETAASTQINLYFSTLGQFELKAEDITLDPKETGTVKGGLTRVSESMYTLAVSNVIRNGNVTITINKSGYEFKPNVKDVGVFRQPPIINKPFIKAVEQATGVTFVKNETGDVLVFQNKELIENITKLDIQSKELENLNGIEHFTKLVELNCSNNKLLELNFSANVKLVKLDVSKNNTLRYVLLLHNLELEEFRAAFTDAGSTDLSKNVKLKHVDIQQASAGSSVSFAQNPLLEYLDCSKNSSDNIDVSANTKLKYLNCASNFIRDINVTKNVELTTLVIYSTAVTQLDVSKNIKLNDFQATSNRISALDIRTLTQLDLTKFTCGNQLVDGISTKDLTLTVTEAQNQSLTQQWKAKPENSRVIIDVK